MNLTSQLQRQNARILSLLGDVETVIAGHDAGDDAGHLHAKVSHLVGWVLVNFEFARTEVLPALPSAFARQLGAEIEQIRPQVERFEARFRRPAQALGQADDYLAQTTALCQQLRSRFERAQELAYPAPGQRPTMPVNRLASLKAAPRVVRH